MTPGRRALQELVGGYLNQDWYDDYKTVWEGVEDFAASALPRTVDLALQESRGLLAALNDEDIERLLVGELGLGYWPPGDGLSFREWLQRVVKMLHDGDRLGP